MSKWGWELGGCLVINKEQAVKAYCIFFYRQVKKSTLNPNAKEFNPTKPLLSVVRWGRRMQISLL